jgi:predicted nucleic acid-binding protein
VIAAARRAAGRPINNADCQIAAIARSHRASVATRDVNDFEGCGIEVINPWSTD